MKKEKIIPISSETTDDLYFTEFPPLSCFILDVVDPVESEELKALLEEQDQGYPNGLPGIEQYNEEDK